MKILIFAVFLIVLTGRVCSQIQIEVYGGLGFTGVDVENWYGGSLNGGISYAF